MLSVVIHRMNQRLQGFLPEGISASISVPYCQYDAKDPEGWMTVRIIKLESELAAPDLARKLTEAGLLLEENHATDTVLHLRLDDTDEAYLRKVAESVAGYLVNDWLYAYIDSHLLMRHSYLNEDEREYVALLTLHALRKASIAERTLSDWEEDLEMAALQALYRTSVTHLDIAGMMRFRAREVLNATETGTEEFVNQFLTDREYEEFVSLLRYMLESQPSTRQIVHVFCTDERMWLCDEAGALIADDDVSEAAHQVSEDGEVNVEDLAMSVLITRSPCKIVIHDITHHAPWPSFAETVERVFLERAARCNHCEACALLENGDQLPTVVRGHLFAMPDNYD